MGTVLRGADDAGPFVAITNLESKHASKPVKGIAVVARRVFLNPLDHFSSFARCIRSGTHLLVRLSTCKVPS